MSISLLSTLSYNLKKLIGFILNFASLKNINGELFWISTINVNVSIAYRSEYCVNYGYGNWEACDGTVYAADICNNLDVCYSFTFVFVWKLLHKDIIILAQTKNNTKNNY